MRSVPDWLGTHGGYAATSPCHVRLDQLAVRRVRSARRSPATTICHRAAPGSWDYGCPCRRSHPIEVFAPSRAACLIRADVFRALTDSTNASFVPATWRMSIWLSPAPAGQPLHQVPSAVVSHVGGASSSGQGPASHVGTNPPNLMVCFGQIPCPPALFLRCLPLQSPCVWPS